MTNILDLMPALLGSDPSPEQAADALPVLIRISEALCTLGKWDEAADVCDRILQHNPLLTDVRIRLSQCLSRQNRIKEALQQLVIVKEQGQPHAAFTELHRQIPVSVAEQQIALSRYDFDTAEDIISSLVQLSPDLLVFQDALIDLNNMRLGKILTDKATTEEKTYRLLQTALETSERLQKYDDEARFRLELSRHPVDQKQHSVLRISNIAAAVARYLGIDHPTISEEHQDIVRELQERAKTIAPMPITVVLEDLDAEKCIFFEQFQRRQLDSIDLQALFDGPTPPTPPLPTQFVDAAGRSMSIEDLQARSQQVQAKAAFFTSTSPEYFERYARIFATSVLKSCDCGCLVVICVCTAHENLVDIIRSLDIDDPRLIFCSDNFDPTSQDFKIYPPNGDPVSTPGPHYATSAMMRSDWILDYLHLPVFLTGIDTVLQRGIVDLLERYSNADVILNRVGTQAALGNQMINNLVMVAPTKNGSLFIQFVKSYLGGHLTEKDQAAAIDQQDLHLAKHHVMMCGENAVIAYFDEYDINNVMFNKANYQRHIDKFRQYRFVNIFAGGCPTNALSEEDL